MRAWIWIKCCMSTDVGTWMDRLTFEPEPDWFLRYRMRCNAKFYYVGKIPRIGRPSLQWGVVLKWFYLPRAMGTSLSEVNALYRVPFYLLFFFCTLLLIFCIHYIPITSTWPHRRCDAGLEEGEYKYKLSLCYSIVYYYNGAQRYEQFLQASWLYRALILLGLALCLPSTFVSLVFVVLYINFFAYILLFTF